MTELNASIRHIPIPTRMTSRPISKKGFPVPWFVAEINGEWDFRVIGPGKLLAAYKYRKCWLCGEQLGKHMVFTVGPMCVVNRTTAEVPSHLACAEYGVRACPFLNNPRMRRNEADMPENSMAMPGHGLSRNPGATALYITASYKPFQAGNGTLFRMGEPASIRWYAEGREATRAEVQASIDSGLPKLYELAKEDDAVQELELMIARAQVWLPDENLLGTD